jgi:hypothetical protein
VTVSATIGGRVTTQDVAVTINQVDNTAPVMRSPSVTQTLAPNLTLLQRLRANKPNCTFQISGGAQAASFEISGSRLQWVMDNRTTGIGTYAVNVTATDPWGNVSAPETHTITVVSDAKHLSGNYVTNGTFVDLAGWIYESNNQEQWMLDAGIASIVTANNLRLSTLGISRSFANARQRLRLRAGQTYLFSITSAVQAGDTIAEIWLSIHQRYYPAGQPGYMTADPFYISQVPVTLTNFSFVAPRDDVWIILITITFSITQHRRRPM